MSNDLRAAVIKLAHAQPALRKPLLAILREASSDPSDISSWSYTALTTVYEWSDKRTKFEIKRRDMRGIIYYVLLVASNETFPDGTPILKTTFQHRGQKEVAEGWSKEVKALYRLIQAAANGEGSVLFTNLVPITSPNDLIKIR
jgi:hypothetical protein